MVDSVHACGHKVVTAHNLDPIKIFFYFYKLQFGAYEYNSIFKNYEPFYLSAQFYRIWQEVPVLVIVSMLAYFCFLEQLLVRLTILFNELSNLQPK